MNRALQPELHPDAESLNAFLEQALPAAEREQILGHMGSCSDCRQIVFLAQQAAAQAEMPAAVPAAVRAARRSVPWYQNWQFVWAPAGALALAAVLAVVLYQRPPHGQTDVARNMPAGPQAAPAATLEQPLAQQDEHQPVPPPARKAAQQGAVAAVESQPAGASYAQPAASGAVAADSIAYSSASPEPPPTAAAPGRSSVSVLVLPAPAQPQTQIDLAGIEQQRKRAAAALADAARTAHTTQAHFKARMEESQAQATRALGAGPTIQTTTAFDGSFTPAAPRTTAGNLALAKAQSAKLPSGLTAVSTAAALHHTVAIDATGALFVSRDAGATWQPVARQWTGRPIVVRVQANAPTAFELVNDSNQLWVSQDGKTWNAQ